MLYHDGVEFPGGQAQEDAHGAHEELHGPPRRRQRTVPRELHRVGHDGQEGRAEAQALHGVPRQGPRQDDGHADERRPRINSVDELVEDFEKIYKRRILKEDTVTVIYFSEVHEDL